MDAHTGSIFLYHEIEEKKFLWHLDIVSRVPQTCHSMMLRATCPTPVSPSKDLQQYREQMLRKKALDVDVSASNNHLKDRILTRLYSDTPGIVALSNPESLSDLIVPIWQKPASIQATPHKINNLCRLKQDSCEFSAHAPTTIISYGRHAGMPMAGPAFIHSQQGKPPSGH